MGFRSAQHSTWIGAVALLLVACAEGQDLNFPPGTDGGDPTGAGGNTNTGGAGGGNTGGSGAGTGGSNGLGGSGGTGGTGGSTGTDGSAGRGGSGGTGGTTGTGGSLGTGGSIGTGGCPAPVPFDAGASGTVLFADNFEGDSGAPPWAFAATGGTPAWAIVAGDAGSKFYSGTLNSNSNIALAANGNATWTDVSVEAKVRIRMFGGSSTSFFAGLCVRVASADTFYCVALRSDGRLGIRGKAAGQSAANLAGADISVTPPISADVWYTLRVVTHGSAVTVYYNGTMVETVTLPGCPSAGGGIALGLANATADFDDVRVTVP